MKKHRLTLTIEEMKILALSLTNVKWKDTGILTNAQQHRAEQLHRRLLAFVELDERSRVP